MGKNIGKVGEKVREICSVHIRQRQTSKKKIANASTIAHCEWVLDKQNIHTFT